MTLEDYQERFVSAVSRVIGANWLRRRPDIRVLDMGCDCSGRQLRELSRCVRGQLCGINVPVGFPSAEAVVAAGPNVQLVRMDGMQLDFPDASFDLVVSANVIEHVPDPVRFINEAARVLRPDGVCYMETAPVWTSARGHHLMESMVATNCPWETRFRDDGTIIPEWSHLRLNRADMAKVIGDQVDARTREYLLHYLYDTNDLNRTPWSVIRKGFSSAFALATVHPRPLPGVNLDQMPKDGLEDYAVYGFTTVCRHRPQNWFSKRLCWRLRRLGF
jgi:ubiquinone/menaquinone biosynthesis C-methylase UbiE